MKKIYIFLSVILTAYIIARAINVTFTHDEATTYDYVRYSIRDILTNNPPTANNHILNTLLAKFCAIFSVHEFSLRLPGLFSFFLYLYTVLKLRTLVTNDRLLQLCFFTGMFANVALLDFFALCRGYAPGISLMLFSVYQLILLYSDSPNRNGRKTMHLCLLSSTLAVFANFALVNPVIIIFILLTAQQYRDNGRRLFPSLLWPVIYGLLLLALCAYPFWLLMGAGELYFGGTSNFINDTLHTMIEDMADGWVNEPPYYIGVLIFFTSIIVLSIGIAFSKIRVATAAQKVLFIGPLLLAGCILLINLQFYLLGMKLIIYRTALYLFPLIVLSAFSAAGLINMSARLKRAGIILVTSLFVFALLAKVNINATREWWYDVYNKEVLTYVLKNPPATGRKTRLFSHWLMSKSLDYYIETRYSKDLELVPYIQKDFSEIDINSYDFVYARHQDGMGAYENFRVVRSYMGGNFLLYQKKQETTAE